MTPSGRAVLAWSAQFASEGGDRGPVYFQTATRAAGARRFARARLLETVPAAASDGLGRPIDAVVDSTGAVAVAWRGAAGVRAVRGGRRRARACRPPARPLCSPTSPPDPAAASWSSGTAASTTRRASCGRRSPRARAARFGPPEDVSPAGQEARFGHAAFLGETPAVVLANRPSGTDTFAQVYVR